MILRYPAILPCLCLALIEPGAALGERLPAIVFSARDGLAPIVHRIVVDSKGFIWFAESEGLAASTGTDSAYSRSGTQQVKAGRRVAQLLTQYFPDLVGADLGSGYIKVTLDRGVAGFALFGTNNLTDVSQPLALSAVPPQALPQ